MPLTPLEGPEPHKQQVCLLFTPSTAQQKQLNTSFLSGCESKVRRAPCGGEGNPVPTSFHPRGLSRAAKAGVGVKRLGPLGSWGLKVWVLGMKVQDLSFSVDYVIRESPAVMQSP